jgi:ubiquinone biosynthesis UbiH/UbiF/VisC/COQ6 family hydroxylase
VVRIDTDIAIVGAGLAGASLAVALRASKLRIALIDNRPPAAAAPGWDSRIYAISPANRRFLDEIGAWAHLDQSRITPVHDMEIYGDRGARLDFSAYGAGVDELAFIIEAGLMQRELWESVKRQPNVTLLCPAQPASLEIGTPAATLALADGRNVEARLVVAADGADSWVRRQAGIAAAVTPYGEKGVVANFTCQRPHYNKAFQWFLGSSVLAWLPLTGNAISIVWSAPDALADELVALSPEALCERVAAAGGHRLGRLEALTPAAAFPLRLMRVARSVAPRIALIGDAAHAIHPLSGHGINLGFQDTRVLAQTIMALPDYRDFGLERELRPFERARAEEVQALQGVTHALNHLFRPQIAPLAWLRNAGLNLTNRIPVVRNTLVRYALG